MNEAKDLNLVSCHPVDESVIPHKKLANISQGEFRNNPAAVLELEKGPGGFQDFQREGGGVMSGIFCDEGGHRFEILKSGGRLNYGLSHLAIFSSTWTWLRVRPS